MPKWSVKSSISQEAIKTFAASDIDQSVMGPFLVHKPEGYQATGSHLSADQVD